MLSFLLYVTLDLSNPFVAGAFNFNPDECVEAIHRASSSSVQRADASALPARTLVVRMELPRRRACDRPQGAVIPFSSGWSTRVKAHMPRPTRPHPAKTTNLPSSIDPS